MLVAGHDSTVNTIAHCVLTAAQSRVARTAARAARTFPEAIEEVLRLQSAVQFFPSRGATPTSKSAAPSSPKGSAVHLLYGRREPRPGASPIPESSTFNARTTSTSAGAAEVHSCVGGPLPHAWKSTWRWKFPAPRREPAPGRGPPPLPETRSSAASYISVEFDRITDEPRHQGFPVRRMATAGPTPGRAGAEPGPGQVLVKVGVRVRIL